MGNKEIRGSKKGTILIKKKSVIVRVIVSTKPTLPCRIVGGLLAMGGWQNVSKRQNGGGKFGQKMWKIAPKTHKNE